MKITGLLFCVLLWFGATESLTNKLVDLGQNVTLHCKISVKDVYWLLMKPSHPPVFILRSYSSTSTAAMYGNTISDKRFSLQLNSTLFIQNVTLNELGFYYCIKITPSAVSNGINLHSRLNTSENQISEIKQLHNQTRDRDEEMCLWRFLLIASGLLNCVLVIAVTGVIVSHCKQSPGSKLQKHQVLDDVQNQFPVVLQKEVQTSKYSIFTVVEFHHFNPVLHNSGGALCPVHCGAVDCDVYTEQTGFGPHHSIFNEVITGFVAGAMHHGTVCWGFLFV
ncbi:uncharacterized protein LOC143504332 [Brachyhypopomus gauderio]|uniref:uncharacterized protein LOC143504332 n=1 Tax=Brachyhypopomus gauderio TaxID=698409 RepID=UPI0040432FD8